MPHVLMQIEDAPIGKHLNIKLTVDAYAVVHIDVRIGAVTRQN